MKRAHRTVPAVFSVALVALVASGCGAEAGQAGPPDQLRIAVEEDFDPLNILNQSDDPLTFLVYDRLVAPSPYAQDPQPWLATEVRNVDPLTWMISLREDVTWHDGQPFTADDVAFTIEWFKRVPSGTYSHHITTVPHIVVEQGPTGAVLTRPEHPYTRALIKAARRLHRRTA